jgi:cytochrome P450
VGVLEEIREAAEDVRHDVERAGAEVTKVLGQWVTGHAEDVFDHLRRHHPIVSTHKVAVVTLADDVRQVLDDYEHFNVLYASKMEEITGPFILGLDGTPLYFHDEAALRAAVRPADLPAITALVLEAARERVAAAVAGDGRIDVVSGLTDPVLTGAVTRYFGTPGPDDATQARWARSLFEDIFINVGNDPAVHGRALSDAAAMRPHLDAQVDARKAEVAAGGSVPDDVLTRLVRGQGAPGGLHDIAIRHNFIGLIVGWIPTVSKAFTLAVEELLHRPEELAGLQRAAAAGDTALVHGYVFEAMRFRPQNWGLLRRCSADTTVAAGTDREAVIHAGAIVIAATQSAMHDERVVDAPEEFRSDRPPGTYMHFGHGLHTCFGQAINEVQLPAFATALFEGAPVSRAPGDAGELKMGGPFPSRLTVALG